MEFLNVKTLDEAMTFGKSLGSRIELETEDVALEQTLGRYLAQSIEAPEDLPAFNRSTVDGYALCHADVTGASEALPSLLRLIGSVEMGCSSAYTISSGEAVYVPTGGHVPSGADAVVMIEYCEPLDVTNLMVSHPVHYNENINRIGDDVRKGQHLISKGHRIGPHDIGLLAGLGIHTVKVYKPLRVSILSTGDELIGIREPMAPGKIRDINGSALFANAVEDGCHVVRQVLVPDDFETLKREVLASLETSDLVLLSGGSSAGTKDHTKAVICAMPEGKLWTHGLAIKPGKPTLIGSSYNKPIIGLPGHPSAALLLYKLIVQRIIEDAYDTKALRPLSVEATLTSRVHASPGKDTFVMVQLTQTSGDLVAQPMHGKSGLISLMAGTCGYLQISKDQEGLEIGSKVKVSVIHPQLVRQEA